mmetsp:Transcript_27198/g.71361  ORF Transcript_27198/g.71361 Transcript_27198/m.71361 type:complete len:220 (-) Transcript_27198:396-1055(-)
MLCRALRSPVTDRRRFLALADFRPTIHECLRASLASMRILGSYSRSSPTRSLASSLTCLNISSGMLYLPAMINSKRASRSLAIKGRPPPNSVYRTTPTDQQSTGLPYGSSFSTSGATYVGDPTIPSDLGLEMIAANPKSTSFSVFGSGLSGPVSIRFSSLMSRCTMSCLSWQCESADRSCSIHVAISVSAIVPLLTTSSKSSPPQTSSKTKKLCFLSTK